MARWNFVRQIVQAIDLVQLDYPAELPMDWDPETNEGSLSIS